MNSCLALVLEESYLIINYWFLMAGHPLKSDIANVVSSMLNEEFTSAYSSKKF